jgi:hypothetical protein
MPFELYTSKISSEVPGLPKSPISIGIRGLFDKMPGEIEGDFIGEFPSQDEIYRFIESNISSQGSIVISIDPPNDQNWIHATFKTANGENKQKGYFLREK